MILSSGYITGDTIIWEIGADQLDFSLTEFDELILAIKHEGLFDYLEENRSTLKSRLIGLFQKEIDQDEMDLDGLEYELEDRLRSLAFRIKR